MCRCSVFSNSSKNWNRLRASIGVTRSYSSRPFLCALEAHYSVMGTWDLQGTLFYLHQPIETFSLCLCRSRQCDQHLHQRRHTSLPRRSECPGAELAGPWQNQHHTRCVCEGVSVKVSMRGWECKGVRCEGEYECECEGVWGCECEGVGCEKKEQWYIFAILCHFYTNNG